MSEKVKDTAVEEFEQVKSLTQDAVRSGAYLYPVKVCFTSQNVQGYKDIAITDTREFCTSALTEAYGNL